MTITRIIPNLPVRAHCVLGPNWENIPNCQLKPEGFPLCSTSDLYCELTEGSCPVCVCVCVAVIAFGEGECVCVYRDE